MPNHVLLEEFHFDLMALRTVPERVRDQIRSVLKSRAFRKALGLALADVLRQFPALNPVRFVVST
jgi:hypothetical protein